jgi:signal transduction histidine kinase
VLRHAHASAVTIAFANDGAHLVVTVHDNGTGIPPAHERRPGSFGLRGIHERAAQLNGTFEIGRDRNHGTIATLRVPLAVLSGPHPSVRKELYQHQEDHENPVGR